MPYLNNIGSAEIIQVADAVAREKNIDKSKIIEAIEDSIAVSARKKFGYNKSIKCIIDRKTGVISLFRELEVVANDYKPEIPEGIEEEEFDADAEMEDKILFDDAIIKVEDVSIGDIIQDPLPPIDLGRVSAQTAKQVIMQKVKEAEREKQYEQYKDRIGEVINGTIKRVEFGNVIVDLGSSEALIPRSSSIRGEALKVNDRIRACIDNVTNETKGHQIILSRTSPEFMRCLFQQEVPEIYDNIIELKNVVREPGSRAKIAVYSNDSAIDPVGSCVGVRGARVQAVSNELNGEKIDIIQWSDDPANLMIRALAPAEISKVVIDEETRKIEAVVPEDQLSLAIGRGGQNVRLASALVGWRIDILTEEDESTKRSEELNKISDIFVNALNIEEIIAQLLVTEGFEQVEEIAYVDISEIAAIEGFDLDIAEELQNRARDYLEQKQLAQEEKLSNLKISDDLKDFGAISIDNLTKLSEASIRSLEDFADLSRDEFVELVPDSGLEDDHIDELILSARQKSGWFDN